ncbi:hypothetical protein ScalyP_jg2371 [Parmales sp. scaly parma]|nr:hypothetical protein ScalyP_jg2371 [Parmales sp. scaly parma]
MTMLAMGWHADLINFRKAPYDGQPWILITITVIWYCILRQNIVNWYSFLDEKYGDIVAGPVLAWTFHMIFYHGHSGFCQVLDSTKGFWNDMKISNYDKISYWEMMPNILKNQLCFLFFGIFAHKLSDGAGWKRATEDYRTDVSWFNSFYEFLVMAMVYELIFYSNHRLLHNKKFNFWGLTGGRYFNLYKLFHKMHHTTFASVGLSGIYMGTLDCILTQTLPQIVGPTLLNFHPMVLWVGALVGSVNAVHTHSGYGCWGMPAPHGHELHHSRYTVNYGTGFFDSILGTGLGESQVEREGFGMGGRLIAKKAE